MAARASSHTRARVKTPSTGARARQRLGGVPRARVGEIQRSRLLVATASVVDELGYANTTVAHITERARISRRTFYDLFADREDCVLALFEDVVGMARREVLAAAGAPGLDWCEQVRAGLWAILSFLDREPVLARVCVVQALRSGTCALERREEVLAELARVLDEGREYGGARCDSPPLTAEGLVGAVFGIVYGRLLRRETRTLTVLFGELMGMIVLPYMGPAAARREQERKMPAADLDSGAGSPAGDGYDQDPLVGVPMRLTYRTARVLEVVAARPGVSNRGVGEQAGVADQGQISRLLARLERLGLTENTGDGHAKGESNAWRLTLKGAQVERSIRAHTSDHGIAEV
jgi:AcrR family transcriptional regulator